MKRVRNNPFLQGLPKPAPPDRTSPGARAALAPTAAADEIRILGRHVQAISPEGKTAAMSVEAFVERAAPSRVGTGGVILPDGVKTVVSDGHVSVWVHQNPPRLHNFQWIADGSDKPFGPGTKYRTVRVALPYLIVLAVFVSGPDGRMTLSRHNECFFRTAPLEDLEGELLFPALLNCSKFHPPEGHPLSWICTQHLRRQSFDTEPDPNRRVRGAITALLRCLLETGFNYSSEQHEGSSWFTESRNVDPRVNTIDAWEAASVDDPLFVLEIPWLKTGLSLSQVIDRILKNHRAVQHRLATAGALARLIFNHAEMP